MKRQSGFTLIELMVVVVIIGILASVAYPNYTDYIRGANRAETKDIMVNMMLEMETYRIDNLSYTTDLRQLGFASVTLIPDNDAYQIKAQQCVVDGNPLAINQCVELEADPRGNQVTDGKLFYSSFGRQQRQLPDLTMVSWKE